MRIVILVISLCSVLFLFNACNTASEQPTSAVETNSLAPQNEAITSTEQPPKTETEASELSSRANVNGQSVTNEQRNDIIRKARASATPRGATVKVADRIQAKATQLATQFCQCKTEKDNATKGACKRRVEKMVDRAWTNLADDLRDGFKKQYNDAIKSCNP